MTRSSGVKAVIVILLLLGVGAGAYWYLLANHPLPERDGSNLEGVADASESVPVEVEVAAVKRGTLVERETVYGQIVLKPGAQQILSPRVAGTIAEIYCEEGQPVNLGAPLFKLDDRVLSSTAQKSRGLVKEARAELEKYTSGTLGADSKDLVLVQREAQAAYNEELANMARARRLSKGNFLSAEEMEKANRALEVASRRLETATFKAGASRSAEQGEETSRLQARLAQTIADQAIADINTSETLISAAFDGVVINVKASVGEFVDSSSILGKVLKDGPMQRECYLSVPAELSAKIHSGQSVYLHHAPNSEEGKDAPQFLWKITSEPFGTQNNGAMVIVTAVPLAMESAEPFTPGEFVKAEIALDMESTSNSLLVPLSAVLPKEDADSFVVSTIGEDGLSHQYPVIIKARSLSSSEVAVISDKLHEGDQVIVSGGYNLPDNTPVKATLAGNN